MTMLVCVHRSGEAPGFPYGDKVVFLANDWHAGLVPTYIAGKYRQHGVYKVRSALQTRSVVLAFDSCCSSSSAPWLCTSVKTEGQALYSLSPSPNRYMRDSCKQRCLLTPDLLCRMRAASLPSTT